METEREEGKLRSRIAKRRSDVADGLGPGDIVCEQVPAAKDGIALAGNSR